MAATQCILLCGRCEDDLLKFRMSVRMVKKGDLGDFECGMNVGARWADGLSISQTADLLGFSHTTTSRVYGESLGRNGLLMPRVKKEVDRLALAIKATQVMIQARAEYHQ